MMTSMENSKEYRENRDIWLEDKWDDRHFMVDWDEPYAVYLERKADQLEYEMDCRADVEPQHWFTDDRADEEIFGIKNNL